ncbi:MAG: UDP-N-acetylmuramate--L-alanine ligase [Sedimentisphaerales bacterium]|nr:UDP-N-acetylmuramate--L-alanine ligase [Sedimentisphaerales bacterium]
MSYPEIGARTVTVKAAHRYEVVEVMSRPEVAGRKFHFIGAGGVGMSGLARLLLENQAVVSGSDQTASAVTSRLSTLGADIHIGHGAANLPADAETVVISAAIREGNPELEVARHRGCRVVKYAQMLGELVNQFDAIAISGTHGKSTTSGWLAYSLKRVGVDVNFVVGADVPQLGGSSGGGQSDYFVVEACEYDRSFQNYEPQVATILNIERDHLDCYRDEEDIIQAFCQFALGTKPGGLIVANGGDPNTTELLRRLGSRRTILTFGLDGQYDFSADNIREKDGFYQFDAFREGLYLGSARISLPGRHNVLNAIAVIATAACIGVVPQRILEVLDGFRGMDRRLMLKGQLGGVTVLDDYAHHPTEIRASLRAIRERYRPQRLWCVFQAHQYSRTKSLLEEFAGSFTQADTTILPEIYFVRDSEVSRSEVNAEILAERIRQHDTNAEYIGRFDAVCDYLEQNVRSGDLVVTMGAGDVWKVADEYIQRLGRNR